MSPTTATPMPTTATGVATATAGEVVPTTSTTTVRRATAATTPRRTGTPAATTRRTLGAIIARRPTLHRRLDTACDRHGRSGPGAVPRRRERATTLGATSRRHPAR